MEVLVPEKYVRQASKAADIQDLKTRLFYDRILLKKIPTTSIFANLVSNYYLVSQSIALLSLLIVDVSKEQILCTITTLKDMLHLVRTAFCEYQSSYVCNIWALPMKPPPQVLDLVNGAALEIWEIVSATLLNSLIEAGFRSMFKCCIYKENFKLVSYYFM